MNRDNDKGKVLIRRSLIMAGCKVFVLLLIIFRLYYLQVYQADKFKMLADENRISTRILIPQRGIIYDRNHKVLATNVQNFQALIVAEQTPNVQETLDAFKRIMPLSAEEEQRIKQDLKRNRSFVPIKVKDNLSWEEVSEIQLNAADLPGIIIDESLNRYYPMGEKTAQVVGYVAAVSEQDRKDDPLLEVPGFKIGKSGIEKYLEHDLRGEGGILKLEVNAYGRVMNEIEETDGVHGKNIVLTLDSRLQEAAYEAFGEESGAAVLLDVHNGEILAFVSTPSFDPNAFSQGLSVTEWNALLEDERHPLTNKVIQGQYSPGSVFKPLVAIAGLESGAIKPDTRFFCAGKMFVGDHPFHCWRRGGHGYLNVVEALKHSCDIYFYETAQKTGIDKIAEVARRFGLGSRVNIGLENEKAGLIPDKEWKLKRFGEPWQVGESLIAGIGQGYVLVTPLQLAMMTARIANGGYAVTPTFFPVPQGKSFEKINVDKKYLDLVKEGMYEVVNGTGGTAWASQFVYKGQRMSGKTGSVQVRRISLKERQSGIIKQKDLPWKYRDHAIFVAYAPADNPKYALAVLAEHGGGGAAVAAPIASKILKTTLELDPSAKKTSFSEQEM